jgi:uncharacterized protein (DUF1778 family)
MKKSSWLVFRLTLDQHNMLRDAAKRRGVSVSELARRAVKAWLAQQIVLGDHDE